MTILLQWLVEHTWVFYTICAIGAIIYLVRALAAHRERDLALFSLERETATARAVRAWVMAFLFVGIGLTVFIGATFILPDLPVYSSGTSLPTSTPRAGVDLTPVTTATITPTEVFLPTLPPLTATVALTATPSPEFTTPAASPTPPATETPTATPEPAISGDLNVRFGDFAALTGYSLPSTEVTTSEQLALTLYWQALDGTPSRDYIVFTHLLSESGEVRLLAQHDGMPAGGTRPITTWSPGETIADSHPMAFKPEFADYTGPAVIAVGLYDPASGRALTETGEDNVVLPVTVNVVSP